MKDLIKFCQIAYTRFFFVFFVFFVFFCHQKIPLCAFFKIILYWHINDLLVGFCCTASWISHMYTYVLALLSLPPTPTPNPLPRSSQNTELSSLCIQQFSASYFIYGSLCIGASLVKWLSGKDPAKAGDVGSIPTSWRSPGGGYSNPLSTLA